MPGVPLAGSFGAAHDIGDAHSRLLTQRVGLGERALERARPDDLAVARSYQARVRAEPAAIAADRGAHHIIGVRSAGGAGLDHREAALDCIGEAGEVAGEVAAEVAGGGIAGTHFERIDPDDRLGRGCKPLTEEKRSANRQQHCEQEKDGEPSRSNLSARGHGKAFRRRRRDALGHIACQNEPVADLSDRLDAEDALADPVGWLGAAATSPG